MRFRGNIVVSRKWFSLRKQAAKVTCLRKKRAELCLRTVIITTASCTKMPNLQAFERSEYQQVKADLHRKILDRLDLEKLGRSKGMRHATKSSLVIRNSVNSEAVPLSFAERERLSREILDEISASARSNRCSRIRRSPTFW